MVPLRWNHPRNLQKEKRNRRDTSCWHQREKSAGVKNTFPARFHSNQIKLYKIPFFFPGCQKKKETSCWQQLIAVCHQGALAVLAAQQGAVLTASEQPSTGPRVQILQLLASARHLHGRKPSNQSRRMTSGPPLPCGASHRLGGALRGKKTNDYGSWMLKMEGCSWESRLPSLPVLSH